MTQQLWLPFTPPHRTREPIYLGFAQCTPRDDDSVVDDVDCEGKVIRHHIPIFVNGKAAVFSCGPFIPLFRDEP